MRCCLTLALILIPALTATVGGAEGLSQLISYTSSLDDSIQQYGIYIPEAPAPSPGGYPAAFHMHGYGWWVGADFSDWQKDWAERHGWVLINLNARGPQFYEGVGDVETLNVVKDAGRRFGLDMTRLYVTGGSMGGTGAFRHGVRYPDIFAAAVGVDGWTDFREWHWHWYARTEQRHEIEEFRRPLLEAASPLYWTGRARWGSIQASVSGRDDIVLPENGLQLYNALLQRSTDAPGMYDNRLYLDYGAGHGGTYRLDQIYEYFQHRQTHPGPTSFLCESPLLTHGRMYWGSMLRLKVQGAAAALESIVEGPNAPSEGPATSRPAVSYYHRQVAGDKNDGPANSRPLRTAATATVLTRNLTEMAIHLEASPAAEAEEVALYADGFLAYQGPPQTVHLQADLSPQGDLWGWRVGGFVPEPAAGSGTNPPTPKTAELEGPVGEAFKRPFLVAYGTAGSPAEVARNRQEAQDFARGWNDFMVHGPGVTALPEEQVTAADLNDHSLILYGTEHSSALLREANARHELPVHVRSDGVFVKDPQWGDRAYQGSKFGAFFCYPNPLADFRQYLVVCRGQWATRSDGRARQGLEYDLEKLPWAYSDYVIFNTDQSDLPHILNVNNKPPVTCYEAGYFVEAGYFDQDWQPYRAATLDRVRAMALPTRLIHVEAMRPGPAGLQVLIADAAGTPTPRARVTMQISGRAPGTFSRNTDDRGLAAFPMAGVDSPCTVVNVMATGAEYDWQADRVRSTDQRGVDLVARAAPLDEAGQTRVTVELGGDHSERLTVRLLPPVGTVAEPMRRVPLQAGGRATVSFPWSLEGVPPGRYAAQIEVTARERPASFSRPVFVTVAEGPDGPLRIAEMTAADLTEGSPYRVTVKLSNPGTDIEQAVVYLSLPADRQYPPPQVVTVQPSGEAVVTFAPPPGAPELERGVHPARVVLTGRRGLTAAAEFTVK